MSQKQPVMIWTNYLMFAVFVGSALVQHNDPDPLRWIVVYTLAAGICLLFIFGRLHWWLAAAVSFVTLSWAGWLAPAVIRKTSLVDIFRSYEMKSAGVELAREMGGLLFVGIWLAILAFSIFRNRRKGPAS